ALSRRRWARRPSSEWCCTGAAFSPADASHGGNSLEPSVGSGRCDDHRAAPPRRVEYHIRVEILLPKQQVVLIQLSGIGRSKPCIQIDHLYWDGPGRLA